MALFFNVLHSNDCDCLFPPYTPYILRSTRALLLPYRQHFLVFQLMQYITNTKIFGSQYPGPLKIRSIPVHKTNNPLSLTWHDFAVMVRSIEAKSYTRRLTVLIPIFCPTKQKHGESIIPEHNRASKYYTRITFPVPLKAC